MHQHVGANCSDRRFVSENEVEEKIQEKGLNAPRVTPDQIDSLMASVAVHCYVVPGTTTTVAVAYLASNGFTLACEFSACASPENFDVEIGAKIATDKALGTARDKLWELEGYSLKKSLEV